MLIALLGLGIDEDLHVVNALKSAAVTTANAAAALIFAVVAELNWAVVCSSPSARSSGTDRRASRPTTPRPGAALRRRDPRTPRRRPTRPAAAPRAPPTGRERCVVRRQPCHLDVSAGSAANGSPCDKQADFVGLGPCRSLSGDADERRSCRQRSMNSPAPSSPAPYHAPSRYESRAALRLPERRHPPRPWVTSTSARSSKKHSSPRTPSPSWNGSG